MIDSLDRMRQELIKAMAGRSVVIRRQCDMTDMAKAAPEKSLPDVPLHQRGFGVTDEDAP